MTSGATSWARFQSGTNLVGILISQEIRPFIEMVEGFENRTSLRTCRIFLDEGGRPYSTDPAFKPFDPGNYRAVVAVGPRALNYLVRHHWPGIIVYGMVLDPKRLIKEREKICGVSLNIPFWKEMLTVRAVFPDVKRIGVLFDPANNAPWFNQAQPVAALEGLKLKPVTIRRKSDITELFPHLAGDVDAILFIPDPTVISTAVIQYIIRKALAHGIAAIGYNRFFFESGAAMSFIIDYKSIGVRVAQQLEGILHGKACRRFAPAYKALVNRAVVERLNLVLGKSLPNEVVVE